MDKEIIDLTLSDDEADEPTPSTKEERELAERVDAVQYPLLSPVDSELIEEAILLRNQSQEAIMFKLRQQSQPKK
ncbi:unnamed protein product [Macrosiphum euphorbiae]|uniref:Uncharacterized protein n=1 Tax=Macrosiphum euphorbiae TaxID=13131 RepID=A0AAV0XCI1_9HEMI|nr:unnamed protein product [Macrosiphum euphorbiae]